MKYNGKVHDLMLGEDVILFVSKAAYVATQRVVNLRNQIMVKVFLWKIHQSFGMKW
jgi:hypothetical protein